MLLIHKTIHDIKYQNIKIAFWMSCTWITEYEKLNYYTVWYINIYIYIYICNGDAIKSVSILMQKLILKQILS